MLAAATNAAHGEPSAAPARQSRVSRFAAVLLGRTSSSTALAAPSKGDVPKPSSAIPDAPPVAAPEAENSKRKVEEHLQQQQQQQLQQQLPETPNRPPFQLFPRSPTVLSLQSGTSSCDGRALSVATSGAMSIPDFCWANPEVGIPECFRCPINDQIMEDPVLADDGLTYERANLVASNYLGVMRSNNSLAEAMAAYLEAREEVLEHHKAWQEYAMKMQSRAANKMAQHRRQVRECRGALERQTRQKEALARLELQETSGGSPTTDKSPDPEPNAERPSWGAGHAPRGLKMMASRSSDSPAGTRQSSKHR